jgi:hypothetical protein
LNQIRQGSCDVKDIFNHGNSHNKEYCTATDILNDPIADSVDSGCKNSKDMFGAVFQKWNKLNQMQKEKSENIISATSAQCNMLETVRNIQNDSSIMCFKSYHTSESMGRVNDNDDDYFKEDDEDDEDSYYSNDDNYNYSDDDNNDSSSGSGKPKRQKMNDDCNKQNTDSTSASVVESSVQKEFVKINITRSPAITSLNKVCNWELCSDFPVWPIGVLPCNTSILHPLYLLEEINGDKVG